MNLTKEVLEGSISKSFAYYLLPSLLACITNSVYCLADVYFISLCGNSNGLFALNICMPLFSIYGAIGLLLAIGGASIMSIAKGQANETLMNKAYSYTMKAMIVIGLVLGIVGLIWSKDIVLLLGASSKTINDVLAYYLPIHACSIFFIFHYGGGIILRNDGAIKLAMYSGIGCNLLNIVLDYLFCIGFNWGISGAAIATSLSSVIGFIILITYLLSGKANVKYVKGFNDLSLWKRIISNGFGGGILELSVAFMTWLFNVLLLDIAGELYVSAYAIISNVAFVLKGLFQGFAQAIQPIISINYGAKQMDRVKKAIKIASLSVLIFALIAFVITIVFPSQIAAVFANGDQNLIAVASHGIRLYFPSLMASAVCAVLIVSLQSMEAGKSATLITILKGVVLVLLFLFILIKVFAVDGVWLSLPFSEYVALLICLLVIYKIMS